MKDFGETSIDFELGFQDCQQQISAHRNPDLRLHRVGCVAQKVFDAKVLLDPFEEQFDLPALPIQIHDGRSRKCEVIRDENEAASCVFVQERDAAQSIGKLPERLSMLQQDHLVASQACRFVDK